MLIRSQNKEMLINFNNVVTLAIGVGKDEKSYMFAHILAETSAFNLGSYSTKEKALTILDEIQKVEPFYYEQCGHLVEEEPTYQMPQDND